MSEVPAEFVTMVETGIDFVRRMGLKVVEMKRCRVELLAPLEINKGHIGSMYAGALFTLAEIPGGAQGMPGFRGQVDDAGSVSLGYADLRMTSSNSLGVTTVTPLQAFFGK